MLSYPLITELILVFKHSRSFNIYIYIYIYIETSERNKLVAVQGSAHPLHTLVLTAELQ
jgi:hypothetical protein